MKRTDLLVYVLITLFAQSAHSQSPQVGIIDFYGARSIKADVRKCLPFKENDTIKFLLTYPDTTGSAKLNQTVIDCLLNQPETKQAKMEFVCCVDEKWMVFIGVSAKPFVETSNSKTKDITLPAELTRTYDSMEVLLLTAIQNGVAGEDDSQGHALSTYAPLLKLQERFIHYSAKHLDLLRDVLKHSMHAHHRAVAAWAIAYYHDKSTIANDLSDAAGDESEDVRNNAIRALGIIVDYFQQKPNQKFTISPDPFIALMNSITWTDRNKSIIVLLALSSNRDPKLLLKLKNEALESLIDMASWRSEGHATAGYIVLGRIAGWKEEEIYQSAKKDRQEMIKKMLSSIR